jgi:hypothetical protein
MKTRRIFMQELKLGCPCGVFCPSSIPSKFLFICTRRKFGFNKKICTKLLIVYVYFQPNSCNTHEEHEWARGTFLRCWRKVPTAHAQWVLHNPTRIIKQHLLGGTPLLRGHGDSQTVVLIPPKTLPHHFHRQKVLCDEPNIYICIALKIINTPVNGSLFLIE